MPSVEGVNSSSYLPFWLFLGWVFWLLAVGLETLLIDHRFDCGCVAAVV